MSIISHFVLMSIIPVDNFGTVVGENPTPYGILALWAVNGLSIVYWDMYFIDRFPMEHFGKLMGLMNFAAGVFQLLQFPLLIWAENQTFTQVNAHKVYSYR